MVKVKHTIINQTVEKIFYEEGGQELRCTACGEVLHRGIKLDEMLMHDAYVSHKYECGRKPIVHIQDPDIPF